MKKRYLFLLLSICLVFLTLVGCTKDTVGIEVSKAVENINDAKNVTLEAKFKFEVKADIERNVEASATLKAVDNKLELTVKYEEMNVTVYVNSEDELNPSIIVNPGMVEENLPNQWVEITFAEIMEMLNKQIKPEPEPNPEPNPDGDKVVIVPGGFDMSAIEEIIGKIDPQVIIAVLTFVSEVKDEYFTAEGKYYVFNKEGKAKVTELFNSVINELDRVLPDQGIKQSVEAVKETVKYDYDIKVKTGKKYLQEVKVSVRIEPVGKEYSGEYMNVELNLSYDKVGSTKVELPKEVMTFEEFMGMFEDVSSQPEVELQ